MIVLDCRGVLDQAANEHRLLNHPFYRAWLDGELTSGDLAHYAEQYRFFEQNLPVTLEAVAAKLPVGRARRLVEENLEDERSRPRPHLALLDDFAAAVGADATSSPSPRTAELIATYQQAVEKGPVAALAVIGAYEVQATEVAASKASSLRCQYQLGSRATEFWDVHAQLEASHANWTAEAIEELTPASEEVRRYAVASAAAWWSFLDDREAARHSQPATRNALQS